MQVSANAVERQTDFRTERIKRRVYVIKIGRVYRDGFQYSEVGEFLQL